MRMLLQMMLSMLAKRARLVLNANAPKPFQDGKTQEVWIRIGINRCSRASPSKNLKDNMASKWHSAKQEAQEAAYHKSKSASASSAHLPAAKVAQRGWTDAALAFSAAAST